jgi:hypothetical protein
MMLSSADNPDQHNWYVNANQSATISPNFTCATYCVNFTFTPVIGSCSNVPLKCAEIPHGGDWTYYCLYHPGIMSGTFRVQPVASFTYTPIKAMVGQNVSFTASASQASMAAMITTYSWKFGDGNVTEISNPTITHVYSAPGSFNVSLTITDNVSNTDTTSKIVNVVAPGIDLNASPSSDTTLVNSPATSVITAASNGSFTGTVSFSQTSTRSTELNCMFTPNSIVLGMIGNSTLSCSSTEAATYTITVFAASGTVGNLTNLIFSFQDFQIATSSPAPVSPGVSATSTITVNALNGFARVVYLTDTMPDGMTCGAITPSSITGSGTATVSCSASVAGNYTLIVTGTGGIIHTSNFVLDVAQVPGRGGLSFDSQLEIGGVVVAVVAVAITLFFLRRKRPIT